LNQLNVQAQGGVVFCPSSRALVMFENQEQSVIQNGRKLMIQNCSEPTYLRYDEYKKYCKVKKKNKLQNCGLLTKKEQTTATTTIMSKYSIYAWT
jgi:hypothetical protein